MAYIDREKLKEQINDTCKYAQATNDYQRGCNNVCDWAVKIIKNMPSEDVVPRSEVERLQAQNETLEILVKDLRFRNKEFQKANEGLAKTIENLEIENDILREAKQEVAKQIFEEIEKNIEKHYNRHIFGVEELSDLEQEAVMNFSDDVSSDLAELKKKYIGE